MPRRTQQDAGDAAEPAARAAWAPAPRPPGAAPPGDASFTLEDDAASVAAEQLLAGAWAVSDPARPGRPILAASPAFDALAGCGAGEAAGRPITQLLAGPRAEPEVRRRRRPLGRAARRSAAAVAAAAAARARARRRRGRAQSLEALAAPVREPRLVELAGQRRDGKPRQLAVCLVPLLDAAGAEPVLVLEFVVDADEARKRAGASAGAGAGGSGGGAGAAAPGGDAGAVARWAEAAQQAVSGAAALVTACRGGDAVVEACAGQLAGLCGYAADELAGCSVRVLAGPDTGAAALRAVMAAQLGGRHAATKALLYRRDGAPFWALAASCPLAGAAAAAAAGAEAAGGAAQQPASGGGPPAAPARRLLLLLPVTSTRPRRVGKYVLGRVLGSGASGVVRLGRNTATDEVVAVKAVDATRFHSMAEIAQVQEEMAVLAALKHDNIIRLHEVAFQARRRRVAPPRRGAARASGCFYIVMEYAGGGSMVRYLYAPRPRSGCGDAGAAGPAPRARSQRGDGGGGIGAGESGAGGGEAGEAAGEGGAAGEAAGEAGAGGGGRLGEGAVRRLFVQILGALEYCHKRRVIHRDLKPENILMSGDTPKIADFGLAGVAAPFDGAGFTAQCGTPEFAAPEVVCGREYEGTAVDLWSVGVMLYEALAGRLPFRGASQAALFRAISRSAFDPLPAGVSADARDLVRRLLTVDPGARIGWAELNRHPWLAGGAAADGGSGPGAGGAGLGRARSTRGAGGGDAGAGAELPAEASSGSGSGSAASGRPSLHAGDGEAREASDAGSAGGWTPSGRRSSDEGGPLDAASPSGDAGPGAGGPRDGGGGGTWGAAPQRSAVSFTSAGCHESVRVVIPDSSRDDPISAAIKRSAESCGAIAAVHRLQVDSGGGGGGEHAASPSARSHSFSAGVPSPATPSGGSALARTASKAPGKLLLAGGASPSASRTSLTTKHGGSGSSSNSSSPAGRDRRGASGAPSQSSQTRDRAKSLGPATKQA
ncbi:OSK3 [Scenedesmus sp. PABB004]|nr:OSK3 [Scenedesmus sp. PABB004]